MPFTDYFQYDIVVKPTEGLDLELQQEIVIADMSELPFESFEVENDVIRAYVQSHLDQEEFLSFITSIEGVVHLDKILVKGQNWNKIWEESFDPITINNDVIVRAPFHTVDNTFKHEIIIEPKMSFGTGHHSTTRLMMESMLGISWKGKSVLDMGCGTGILAILAHQLGATNVTASDNDPQCIENAEENTRLNNCLGIYVCLADKISANFKTDIILANIQKNVLIEQMPLYKLWLNKSGLLLVSGIYEEAMEDVKASAEQNGLKFVHHRQLNEWCMIRFDLNEAKA